jgi:hypothetical protein
MKASPASIHIAKSHNADPKAKTWQRVWLPLHTIKDNDNRNNIKQTNHSRQRSTGGNRRLAQWRLTWLIEHSTSHQLCGVLTV